MADPKTTVRPWVDWQHEAKDRMLNAQHAVHQARPDIAIQCLQAAIDILQKANADVSEANDLIGMINRAKHDGESDAD